MNIVWGLLQALFGRKKEVAPAQVEERVPYGKNPLAGMPLDYLIGNSNPQQGKFGRITEVGYDINLVPKNGIGVAYVNLFDEENTGRYGPYLHDSDTAAQYGEGQIDPKGTGWMRNLSEQFRRRQKSGFKYIELDNPDAYDTSDVNNAVSLAAEYGLRVIAKNPGICQPDPVSYIKHANIYGIIVERGAGTPTEMEELRQKAKRPELPVWFVFFSGTRHLAEETAKTIKDSSYKYCSVTYSARGEYGSSEDVLLPTWG